MTTPSAKATASLAPLAALAQVALGALGKDGGDASYGSIKRGLREAVARDPMDAVLASVLGSAYLFYVAEKGKNPKVTSFWDALVFITTCLSVGYDDVFARTDAGKAVASVVMTFGPAMSGAILDPPAAERPDPERSSSAESVEVQRQILARLDAILAALGPKPETTPPEGHP